QPVHHLLAAGLDADQDASKTAPGAEAPQLLLHAYALIGAHGGGPAEAETAPQDLLADGGDARLVGEIGLVLEVEIVEAVALPQGLELLAHALGLVAVPAPIVDLGVGAEGAPEAASLRRDVVELALPLDLEEALDVDELVAMGGELVEVAELAAAL